MSSNQHWANVQTPDRDSGLTYIKSIVHLVPYATFEWTESDSQTG